VANLPVFLPYGKRAAAAHLVEDFLGHGLSLQKGSGRFFRRPEGYGRWKTG